jgi:tRNA A37 N6-isopentenylltransferase MiaA
VEVDNKRADLNPKVEKGPIATQKYNSKQATWFRVAHARLV